ncbi:MAG: ribose-5-phosphate isomerase RpiA [Acetobacteraceae bacterium]|nr:ribose-5-phosphate isomerase RpiA [Acetobacteraceae bacterium]
MTLGTPGDTEADAAKRASATAAVALVENGMRLGLGSGTTMKFAVEALGRRVRAEGLQVRCVATSVRTEDWARADGVTVTDFASVERLDLAIDGADEVETGSLRLIKGLGGALLREKIVAEAASRFVVIVDPSKIVGQLGERAPVPVEVLQFGHEMTERRLAAIAGRPVLRLLDGSPYVTDNGNLIYDCHTGVIADPVELGHRLGAIAGVVGHGLFLSGVERVLIGEKGGAVREMQRAG